MIFLSVLILGTRKGALAGASAQRCPTFWAATCTGLSRLIIKYIMATVMGLFIDKIMPNRKGNWLIGSIVGGIVQIILYTVFKVFLFDWAYAIGGVPGLTSQTITGVVLATVLVVLFNKAGIMQKLREM